MKTTFTISIRRSVLRALRLLLIDTLCGGACGGLYGFVFGGFGTAGQAASHRLFLIAGLFAVCGAVVGFLAAAAILISKAVQSSAIRFPAQCDRGAEKRSAMAVRPIVTPGHHRPQQHSQVAV